MTRTCIALSLSYSAVADTYIQRDVLLRSSSDAGSLWMPYCTPIGVRQFKAKA